jgi:hypothetical protein
MSQVRTAAVLACLACIGATARVAGADDAPASPECRDAVTDPIVTAVRDGSLDAQRGACMRTQVGGGLAAAALIDTPGFHGQLGGGLVAGGSLVVGKAHELSAEVHLVDYSFVQNAVNKVTHTGLGPVVVGAAAGKRIAAAARAALSLRVEVPGTRTGSDAERSAAQLAGVVTGMLAPTLLLHGRLGALGSVAWSSGGTTMQLAFVAGADLAWHVRTRLALDLGADAMAGWHAGFDHLLVRTGVQWRMRGGASRLRIGVGLPFGGAERTNGVLDLRMIADL